MDEWTENRWIDFEMDGWINHGVMEGWKDGHMDELMDA